MSVASQVALAVAERVERTGGVRAGLVAYRALASNTGDPEVRGKALLAGLRCAAALRDPRAASDLSTLWESVDEGVWDGEVIALCKEFQRAGLAPSALELAGIEARRHRTARSLYLHARCLELSAGEGAADRYRDAAARATAEGAKDLETAARVRRATLLGRSWSTMSEALAEAARVDVPSATAAARLDVAAVLLHAPSRFVRATAIGYLDDLTTGDDVAVAARALRLAARFADEAFPALTPLEFDRVVALLGRERVRAVAPRAIEVATTLRRLSTGDAEAALAEAARLDPALAPLHDRARDILRGRFEPARGRAEPGVDRRTFHAELVLDAVVAMRDGAPARAADALRALVGSLEDGDGVPLEAVAIAQVAAVCDDAELRGGAAAVLRRFLATPSYAAPTGGFLALAETVAVVDEELAATARRAAAVRKERGASEALGTSLARAGWEHARLGRRGEAIERLREAKVLLDGG